MASLNFVNAYAVNTATTLAGKEQNSVDFSTTALGAATITDGSGGVNFSGNDVVVKLTINNTDYFGWISRPIKSGGVVKGFYFWRDNSFSDLATATTDANRDTDGNDADNSGFVLVVDQAFFNGLSANGGLKNVGSSSDRVDSALNSVLPTNTAPVAFPDTSNLSITAGLSGGPALEAGGISNGTAGANAIGNVLSNDTDADAGDTKAVQKAGIGSANTDVTAGGTPITGKYGTLTLKSDGSYDYAVANNNTDVQKLLSSSTTLTDTFYYQMRDSAGATSTSTLAVTIKGQNDAPVANVDFNTAKETITAPAAIVGYTATGNVLTNDTDVDAGDTKSILGMSVTGGATVGGVNVTAGSASLVFTGSGGFSSVNGGEELYVSVGGTYYAVYAADGSTRVSIVSRTDTTGGAYLTLTADPGGYRSSATSFTAFGTSYQSYFSNKSVAFYEDTGSVDYTVTAGGNVKTATTTSAQSTGYTTITNLSGLTGTVAIGMTVTSSANSGIPAGTKISDLTYTNGVLTSIKLDTELTATTTGSFTFTGSSSVGTDFQGAHGTLRLNADGSYVYTPKTDNPYLGSGQSAQEVFNYTMKDAAGATSSSQLKITVYGTGTSDPVANNDTATATEASGTANGTAGVNISKTAGTTGTGLLGNDTTPAGTTNLAVTSFKSADGTTGAVGTPFIGAYGTLTINADGSYTYTVDQTNATVQALSSASDTISENFTYSVVNSAGGISTATLTITVQGANDAPAAADVNAIAIEASGTNNLTPGINPSGNVLSLASDVDGALSAIRVTSIRTGGVEGSGTAGTIGTTLTGTYGSLTMNADGTWTYLVNQDNQTVNALTPGQNVVDSFNFTITDINGSGLSDIGKLNITIEGAQDNVAVNNIYINEATPWAIFTVTGVAGQSVTLSLGNSTGLAASDAKATLSGVDVGSASGAQLQYYNGTTWADYSSSAPIQSNGKLLVRVAINQDNIHEGNESFTLNVISSDLTTAQGIATIGDEGEGDIFAVNGSGAPIISGSGTPTLDLVATKDDDRPLTVSTITVNEGSPYAVFDVTGLAGQAISLTATNGTAIAGATTPTDGSIDYGNSIQYWNPLANGGIGGWQAYSNSSLATVPSSGALKVRLSIVNDTANEGPQTFTLNAAYSTGKSATGTATIDDRGGGVIYTFDPTTNAVTGSTTNNLDDDRSVSIANINVNEVTSFAIFDVTGIAGQVVKLALSNGTATGGATTPTDGSIDFVNSLEYWDGAAWQSYTPNNYVVIPTGGILQVRTAIINDTAVESNETFTLIATNLNNTTVSATATIIDNDGAPTINISNVTVSEAAGSATLTLTRSGATGASSTVDWATVNGTATGNSDFTPANGTITFAAGETSKSITVPIADDNIAETSEAFTIALSNISGATIGGTGIGTVTITDNDTAGLIISNTTLTTTEAGQDASFTVKLSSQPTSNVTITVSSGNTGEGTVGPTTLTFTTSNWNTPQTVNVTHVDDFINDGDVSYSVSLSAASSDATYQGKTGTVSVTNIDNDTASSISIADVTISESGGSATITFTRSGATGGAASVAWTTSNGTAIGGSDFTSGSGTVNFLAGETTKTISIPIINDAIAEGTETFSVTLSSATGATIGTGTATVTINDNDTAGLTITGGPLTTTEGGTTAQFTLVLTSQPTADVTVVITGLDATEGTLSTTSLTFTALNWNQPQTVTVTGVDDALFDGNQTYTLTATANGGGYVNKTGTIIVTNQDNEMPVPPVITNVTETPTDPTPNDLLTGDVTQVLTVTGTPGFSLKLYTLAGQLIPTSGYTVTETTPGVFQVDAQGINLAAGQYVVRQSDSFGHESTNSNSFTIDTTPELEEKISARSVQGGNILTGQFEVIDQNRVNLAPFQGAPPITRWYDADGEQAVFGLQGGVVTGNIVTATLVNGASLQVNRMTGAYTYRPDSTSTLDSFGVTVRDPGGKGGNLALNFETRDLLDRDGVPGNSEDRLATRLTGIADNNGDGIADSTQNAVTTMAWTKRGYFDNAVQGQVDAIPTNAVITVVANQSAAGTQVSSIAQLINFNVLSVNRDGSGGLPLNTIPNVFTPWDALAFSIEPLQSLGLIDIDANRPGLQQRITIDISKAGVREGEFQAYYKWISADTIAAAQNAGVALVTLDGVALTAANQAGWYDFTSRVAGGDGARYIVNQGMITGIELILTDNAFGDIDFTVGRITDPGMPVALNKTNPTNGAGDTQPPVITGPSGTPGAAATTKAIYENTTPVFTFTANENVTWSIAGGNDSGFFRLDSNGALFFRNAPDYEAPLDAGRNNVYELTIRAVDVAGNAAQQAVSVSVLDVAEGSTPVTSTPIQPPSGTLAVYKIDLRSGDRMLSLDGGFANAVAQSEGSVTGVQFWVRPDAAPGFVPLIAWQNLLTGDLYYAPQGTALPYACYVETGSLGYVARPGQGSFDLHLWIGYDGITQIVNSSEAQQLGLVGKGFTDLGALFASA